MQSGAQLWTHAAFLVFVAGAVYAQALTGFALALILLGLIGATNLVPLPDAVNATTVLGFCTAWIFVGCPGPVGSFIDPERSRTPSTLPIVRSSFCFAAVSQRPAVLTSSWAIPTTATIFHPSGRSSKNSARGTTW